MVTIKTEKHKIKRIKSGKIDDVFFDKRRNMIEPYKIYIKPWHTTERVNIGEILHEMYNIFSTKIK